MTHRDEVMLEIAKRCTISDLRASELAAVTDYVLAEIVESKRIQSLLTEVLDNLETLDESDDWVVPDFVIRRVRAWGAARPTVSESTPPLRVRDKVEITVDGLRRGSVGTVANIDDRGFLEIMFDGESEPLTYSQDEVSRLPESP